MKALFTPPNVISASRGIAAIAMLFFPVFSMPFWILYCWGGFSDMIDGPIARRMNAVSELGSMIDSIADLLFLVCSAIMVFPVISLPIWIWIWVAAIGVIKAACFIKLYRIRDTEVPHSRINKLTGFLLFCLPLSINTIGIFIHSIIVCIVASVSVVNDVLCDSDTPFNKYHINMHRLFIVIISGILSFSCQKIPDVNGNENSDPDAIPENYVKVEKSFSQSYYICKYALSNAEWKVAVDAGAVSAPQYWNGNQIPDGKENLPVLFVSYVQAQQYCQWLDGRTGGWHFRLPTKEEWKYAAAGPEEREFPWGNNSDISYANGILTSKFNYNGVIASEMLKTPDRLATYNNAKSTRFGEQDRIADIISISKTGGVTGWVDHTKYLGFIYTDIFSGINETGGNTCPVDAYPDGVSWCGCYNMAGNCWEWTSTVETAQNGAEKGQSVNVICGGSWYANASSCKTSFEGEGRKATGSFNTVGIRLVAQPVVYQ